MRRGRGRLRCGVVLTDAALNMSLEADVDLLRVEAGLSSTIDSLIEVAQAGEGEEMLCNVVLDPCSGAESAQGVAGKIALLDRL